MAFVSGAGNCNYAYLLRYAFNESSVYQARVGHWLGLESF